MEIISKKISRDELNKMDSGYFEDKIKAVADIEKQKIGVDAELRGERVLRETLFAPQRGDRRSDNVLFHCMNLQKAFYPDEPRIGAPG